jgi:hypothetical protein
MASSDCRRWQILGHLLITMCYYLAIPTPCQSLEFIRQYPTFPNNAARPKFTQQPTDMSAEIGSQVQLKCSGEASPPPMLFWYKEGHRQLMFPSQPSPPTAQQSQQPNSRSPPHNNWQQQSATFTMPTTSDNSPAINRLFSMPIGTDSHPNPSTNYFGNRIYVDSQGTLNIVNVTYGDSGYWACALVSSVGSVMAKAKLSVKQSPFNSMTEQFASVQDPLMRAKAGGVSSTVGKYDLLPPPVIKMGSANQTLPTNTSVTLLCEVVSQVAYKIQWFFESQPLQEDPPRLTVLENGNLFINNLRISDTGLYTCVVTAAEDTNMLVAHPFEPLEASMLTSAPPTYQSTAHSCMLKVAAPTTFHIQLFKEDTYAYPSSPGAPYMVAENGPDAITIAWAPPGDSGKLPVKQYVVEHYDTSQESAGWRVIHRLNGKESLLIDGLSAEGSHFFVVRATNGRGTGPSSAIAGPMRTQSGQIRYQQEQQRLRNPTGLDFADTRPDTGLARDRLMTVSTNLLSLTPIGSGSIKLQWSTTSVGNSSYSPYNSLALSDFLEGFSVRYRAIGIGESLLNKDPLFGVASKNQFEPLPSSMPLVTSYVDEDETVSQQQQAPRSKRDVTNYYDFTTEFNEVKVTDHNADHFTIKDLRPFTTYQFFVVPYYKEIDGVPSNILTAQTNEDRPDVAPTFLDIRPISNSSIRLIWSHIPANYAHGIIRGYLVRINQSDILTNQLVSSAPKVLTISMAGLIIAPTTSVYPESKIRPTVGMPQYVVMYDIANLTYKSFYSLEVAGLTVGPGPWSEPKNFIMDPDEMANLYKSNNDNELSDLVSGSFLSRIPNSLDNRMTTNSQGYTSFFVVLPVILIVSILLLVAGFVLYRRNNQQVITWKKTISEHFTNKFYLPSTVDHDLHRGPGSLQQNIYDHQHHLIYSAGSTHMAHQPMAAGQTMWTGVNNNGNGCVNSSGTGSLSSHGGLLPISNDPNSTRIRGNTDQVLIMNQHNKDINSRYMRGNNGSLCQATADQQQRLMGQQHHQPMHNGGDYYSVMNNVAEYEELDQQQRQQQGMQVGPAAANFVERHQTGSSNSDTSCPSSVTRLLPNQNYNRGGPIEQQRHEMILQQQVGCNGDIKQPIITMINGNESGKFQQNNVPLSPYATTNLMNQLSHQPQQAHIFANPQMNLVNQHRLLQQQQHQQQQHQLQQQQNLLSHPTNSTMDDSSRMLMAQQMNGGQGPSTAQSFRTLQRHTAQLQPSVAHSQPTHLQRFLLENDLTQFANNNNNNQSNYLTSQQPFQAHSNLVTNCASKPLVEAKSNFYEHIDYDGVPQQQISKSKQDSVELKQHELVTSSASSGSVRSQTQQQQQQYQSETNGKFRRCTENESHDLRVFASGNTPDAERQRLNFDGGDARNCNGDDEMADDLAQVDETTAFRHQPDQSEELRTRQLSKRRKKQQRSRLHNESQQNA